jgi:hypothetical protein
MNNREEVIASIKVMRVQEATAYAIAPDYLHQHQPPINVMMGPLIPKSIPVDAECRFKMAEWKHQVVDFCKFQRETVAISMSYLDRFLASPSGNEARNNRKIFQLAAMASLYTAIKVNEPEAVDPKTIAGLSRGAHNKEEVETMERQIIGAIDWRLHPPTALAFCHCFFALLPDMETDKRETVLKLATFQTEVAVSDYFFVGINPSTIAFAAIVNAFQSLNNKDDIKALQKLATTVGIDLKSKELLDVKNMLFQSMVLSPSSPKCIKLPLPSTRTAGSNTLNEAHHVSPRGVHHATMNYKVCIAVNSEF